jgi:hypothetical protein
VWDLSIIYLPERIDRASVTKIQRIFEHTFVPYQMYLPLPPAELDKLDLPGADHVHKVPVSERYSAGSRVDAALKRCEGDYVAIVPPDVRTGAMWVSGPAAALDRSGKKRAAAVLATDSPDAWGAVLRASELRKARKRYPLASLRRTLEQAGFDVRAFSSEDYPLPTDRGIARAEECLQRGDYLAAAEMLEATPCAPGDMLLPRARAVWARYMDGGCDEQALALVRRINAERPLLDTLLMEATLRRRTGDIAGATQRLETVRDMIERESPCYPSPST